MHRDPRASHRPPRLSPLSQPARRVAVAAELYRRSDVVQRPVSDLPPAELAVIWRTGDRRTAVRIVVDTCFHCTTVPQAS